LFSRREHAALRRIEFEALGDYVELRFGGCAVCSRGSAPLSALEPFVRRVERALVPLRRARRLNESQASL